MSELSALTGGEGYGACADDAGIAHLVERHLAKVEVASSSLVARSRTVEPQGFHGFSFCL